MENENGDKNTNRNKDKNSKKGWQWKGKRKPKFPKRVLNDFLNDLIDKDYAEQVYGVIISKNKVDQNETILKRKILKKDNKYKFSHFKLFHKSIGISYENWIKSYRA